MKECEDTIYEDFFNGITAEKLRNLGSEHMEYFEILLRLATGIETEDGSVSMIIGEKGSFGINYLDDEVEAYIEVSSNSSVFDEEFRQKVDKLLDRAAQDKENPFMHLILIVPTRELNMDLFEELYSNERMQFHIIGMDLLNNIDEFLNIEEEN